jgi:3-hydroxyisobutyrate dehydrogenase
MLGYPQDLENVIFNNDGGILQHMKPGAVLVDHTTSSPNLAKRIYEESNKLGLFSIDAPVSGGDIGAKSGQLVVMCGGDQEPFNHVRPFY